VYWGLQGFELRKGNLIMHCDEIQERIVDLVYYDTEGVSSANADIVEHINMCSACSEKLEELRQTRRYLQLWKDEPSLRGVTIAGPEASPIRRSGWKYLRYVGIAAMAAICFLALANAQIAWNKNGFSFSTRLLGGRDEERDYYTKTELRSLVKRALDDSESRTNEANYLMMQKMLDVVEQDRWMDMRLVRDQPARNHNRN
jgi:hypothetical protein